MAISLGLLWIVDILIGTYRFSSLSRRISEPLEIYFKNMIIFSNVTLNRVYHHIDTLEFHQKYLGFAWETDGKLRFLCFYCVDVWSKYCTIPVYQTYKSSDQALEKFSY